MQSRRDEFFTFLQFPTIGTLPESKEEMRHCADWLKAFLSKIGLETELWESPGHHPCLFGKRVIDPQAPTILFYMHYDVQPVDPIKEWITPPFQPTEREGEFFARGACDDKGQCFYALVAIEQFLKENSGKINIKVLIEGEEESGSEGLSALLPLKKDELKSDYLLIVDSGIPSMEKPMVTVGVRGITTLEVRCISANGDMHSGILGGIALNPIREMISALSKMWDDKGHVAIPYFYDDLRMPSREYLELIDLSFDEGAYRNSFGLTGLYYEEGFHPGECNAIRPVLEINGISGGYQGEGFKTVIPSEAMAKISCRLVPNQDPDKVAEQIEEFLQKNIKEGIEVKVRKDHGGFAAWGDPKGSLAQAAAKAYEEVFNLPCSFCLLGASIPIAAELKKCAEAEMVLMGLVLPTDGMHAPNEHFSWDRMEYGYSIVLKILERLCNESVN